MTPEQRAAFLESLAAGVPIPRALAAALGIPQRGRAWLMAWAALTVMRREDAEIAAACEGAERRSDALRREERLQVSVGGVGSPASGPGSAPPREDEPGGEGSACLQAQLRDVAPRAEGLRDDRAEQGAPILRRPEVDADVGTDDGHRDSGGRGREAPPEAAEGGGSPGGERVGHVHADGGVGEPGDVDAHPRPDVHSVDPGWAALMSAPVPDAPTEPADEGDTWSRVRREADDIASQRGYYDAPAHFRTLLWIDARCVAAGMHPLDVWWLGTLLAFYASGKLVLVCRVGLRGAKSVTICRALVNDALFSRCDIDPGTVAVIPIMSADRTEATDRFHTIRAILAACGVRSDKGEDLGGTVGGLGLEYEARTLPSGGGVIKVQDCEGRAVEFRIYPAKLTGVIGHTDKAGFGDELDTWPVDLGVSAADVAQRSVGGKANPADVVLDRWLERFTTTRRTAHLYLVSASYFGEDTAHARKVREGDTAIQMVARLGSLGAERDNAARLRLANVIREPGRSVDSRLLVSADPFSPNVPAWVTSPVADIETCYALSRERLGPMFGRYGGRPDEAEGARGPLSGVEFPVHEALPRPSDVVVGLAPGSQEWGRVAVSMCGDAFVVHSDDSRGNPLDPLMVGFSVIACATDQARAVEAERLAWLSGRPGASLPPVAPQPIYDGNVLRLSPLRTLYERGRLRHAPGLATLEAALRGHRDDSDRNPRLEALLAAVTRLVACYPWLGSTGDEEPWKGPGAVDAMHERGASTGDVLRRLGAR